MHLLRHGDMYVFLAFAETGADQEPFDRDLGPSRGRAFWESKYGTVLPAVDILSVIRERERRSDAALLITSLLDSTSNVLIVKQKISESVKSANLATDLVKREGVSESTS